MLAAADGPLLLRAGEELTMSYGSDNRRPDASLLQYGFVEARGGPLHATGPLMMMIVHERFH